MQFMQSLNCLILNIIVFLFSLHVYSARAICPRKDCGEILKSENGVKVQNQLYRDVTVGH